MIANKFASVYHILTKLGTKMRSYTTFLCTKFQGNQIARFHFMVALTPLRKEEKNKRKITKKLSQFLEVHTSETPVAISLKFGMWGTDSGGHLHNKNRPVSYKQHEVTYTRKSHYCSIRKNCIIVLHVNILTGVARASFLGCTTHYRVS